jgi:hypothetical protein
MLRRLFRMPQASPQAFLMLRKLFRMLHLLSYFRSRSILQCLIMPFSLPPVIKNIFELTPLLHFS